MVLLAGLRADELLRANVGDLRRTDDGAAVRGHRWRPDLPRNTAIPRPARPSDEPVSMPTAHAAHLSTDYATRSPPSSPIPTSAATP